MYGFIIKHLYASCYLRNTSITTYVSQTPGLLRHQESVHCSALSGLRSACSSSHAALAEHVLAHMPLLQSMFQLTCRSLQVTFQLTWRSLLRTFELTLYYPHTFRVFSVCFIILNNKQITKNTCVCFLWKAFNKLNHVILE